MTDLKWWKGGEVVPEDGIYGTVAGREVVMTKGTRFPPLPGGWRAVVLGGLSPKKEAGGDE